MSLLILFVIGDLCIGEFNDDRSTLVCGFLPFSSPSTPFFQAIRIRRVICPLLSQ